MAPLGMLVVTWQCIITLTDFVLLFLSPTQKISHILIYDKISFRRDSILFLKMNKILYYHIVPFMMQ